MAEIDRRKADLDRVRERLETLSPSQIALMRELLIGSGRASAGPVQRAKCNVSASGRVGRGTLIQTVQRVIEHRDLITSTAVLSDLNKEGFKFANENPIAAVSAVLSKLHKRGRLIMIRKGKGAIPTQFRKAGNQLLKRDRTPEDTKSAASGPRCQRLFPERPRSPRTAPPSGRARPT